MSQELAKMRAQAMELHKAGKLQEAAHAYARYLARNPNDASIWSNLGSLHRSQGRHQLSLRAHRRAVEGAPDDLGLLNNLANVLSDIGQYDESITIRSRILMEEPDNVNHLAMIGRCLRGQGKYSEAAAHLQAAIDIYPDEPELQLQLAFAKLGQGDYQGGFAAYKARWNAGELKPRKLSYPQWSGEDLTGRSITVLPEQGFGDAVLFMRFLPYLKDLGASVRVAAEPPMLRLFEGLPGADEVVAVSSDLPPTDFWVNMMDIAAPALVGSGAIPTPTTLNIPQDSQERARDIIRPFSNKKKVGVVWTGSATYKGNAFRSFSHTDFLPLADVSGIQLFSLYKGPFLKQFYADGADGIIVDAGSSERDFADCAGMMREMDLVITSDTATAHIAGSLGVPTWVVLHWDPFWVWTHTGQSTPWYPKTRLFRQKLPFEWNPVLNEVKIELERL